MTTLSDVTEFIIDSEHKTAPTAESGYLYVRTPNIGRGYLILDNAKLVSEKSYRKWTRRATPQKDDLILAREAPIGNVAIIPDNVKLCLGQRTVLIRPDKKLVNPRYLMFLLLGEEIQHKFHAYGSGATVPHLNLRDIRSLKLPTLPSMDVQNKVANLLGCFDDLVEINLRRIVILEEIAQTIYNKWFVHFRYPGHENMEIIKTPHVLKPKGWKFRNLGEISEITMGQSPKSVYYNQEGKGLPFHQGVTDFGEIFPTTKRFSTKGNRIADSGDILFSVRAPVGRMNIANTKMILGRGLCGIRSKSGHQMFLYEQLKTIFHEEDIIGGGTIFKAVTKKDMHNIQAISPEIGLVDNFEDITRSMLIQIQNLTSKNSILREARDLLLPKLISGIIDVSEINMNALGD